MAAPTPFQSIQATARRLLPMVGQSLSPFQDPVLQLMDWALATKQHGLLPDRAADARELLDQAGNLDAAQLAHLFLDNLQELNLEDQTFDPSSLDGLSPQEAAQTLLLHFLDQTYALWGPWTTPD